MKNCLRDSLTVEKVMELFIEYFRNHKETINKGCCNWNVYNSAYTLVNKKGEQFAKIYEIEDKIIIDDLNYPNIIKITDNNIMHEALKGKPKLSSSFWLGFFDKLVKYSEDTISEGNYLQNVDQIVRSVFGKDADLKFTYFSRKSKLVPEFKIIVYHAKYEGTCDEAGYPVVKLLLDRMKIETEPQCEQCLNYVKLCLELYNRLQDMMNKWLMNSVMEDKNE